MSAPACPCGTSPVLAKGLCARCYQRQRRGALPGPRRVRHGDSLPSVRVAPETLSALARRAGELGVTPSEVVRRALAAFLRG